MSLLAEQAAGGSRALDYVTAAVLFVAVTLLVLAGWKPLRDLVERQEAYYDRVLRRSLLVDISPRLVTVAALGGVVLLALIAYVLVPSVLAALVGAGVGFVVPTALLKFFRWRRLYRLEDQLVDGIQTLSSGVRAGLNLIQAMDLLAKNGVRPISEEFAHMMREYEHGVPLERAMANASERIGSSNYRLVFSALLTHRERGGDLGETLDRIADSIREIHRLEKKIETLTAPNRTAARWTGAMPLVILGILYVIDKPGVEDLFRQTEGRAILLGVAILNVAGFLWIRKIVAIDV